MWFEEDGQPVRSVVSCEARFTAWGLLSPKEDEVPGLVAPVPAGTEGGPFGERARLDRPGPGLPPGQWARTAIEALDADAVRAAMSEEPISGGVAADRIAAALGTPNTMCRKAAVTLFVVRRFISRDLLVDLSVNLKARCITPVRSPRPAREGTWPSSSPRTPRSAPTKPPTASA
ncbi:hypothetical protein [Streptomyces sp. bgisy126]|uniref:hypothetical protein n=1 Tax=unclassified Streptomyces TaxID=2593676 RepID=UPI003EBB9F3C